LAGPERATAPDDKIRRRSVTELPVPVLNVIEPLFPEIFPGPPLILTSPPVPVLVIIDALPPLMVIDPAVVYIDVDDAISPPFRVSVAGVFDDENPFPPGFITIDGDANELPDELTVVNVQSLLEDDIMILLPVDPFTVSVPLLSAQVKFEDAENDPVPPLY
jgi:hypothetical protein